MVNKYTCEFCDGKPYNTIGFFGTKKLRKNSFLLCKEHSEVFQDELIKLIQGLEETKNEG